MYGVTAIKNPLQYLQGIFIVGNILSYRTNITSPFCVMSWPLHI